jgi:hypothetical protein
MSEQNNSPNYVVCQCQHCDGHIEFDANELVEENCIVSCPHCGLETKIGIPTTSLIQPTEPCTVETFNSQQSVVVDYRLGPFSKYTTVLITPPQAKSPEGQELIKLLVEIEQDGFVTEKGLQRLHDWLKTKSDSKIRAIIYLLDLSGKVLGCGKLTMDNRYEMQKAIERVLPKDIRDKIKTKRYRIESQLPPSEATLARIRELGGNPKPGITRNEAFQMESYLESPATENQIAYIRRLGGNPSPQISLQAASDLINELLHSTKATVNQMQFIRDLGENPPKGLSRADAEILIPQLLKKQRESLAKEQSPTPRQMMVVRFWNKTDLMQSSKWEVEQWLTKFYEEDSRRVKAWELFKAEVGDDGSQNDPSLVPLGAGENYLKRFN